MSDATLGNCGVCGQPLNVTFHTCNGSGYQAPRLVLCNPCTDCATLRARLATLEAELAALRDLHRAGGTK